MPRSENFFALLKFVFFGEKFAALETLFYYLFQKTAPIFLEKIETDLPKNICFNITKLVFFSEEEQKSIL
jgi:hypothetical protein